ncbi:MAG: DEAD/DEAH box helicase [Chloroflexi bacterium]|nr:DEAD/DEAH box helicase [Chloroflexota bacterium]
MRGSISESGGREWTLNKALRPWQEEALSAWMKNGCRGILAVATGAGKTTVAEAAMRAIRVHYPSARFIIIVPTVSLADQWYVSLVEDLCVPRGQIRVFSSRSSDSATAGVVNVFVINTARCRAPSLAHGDKWMLVVDECHRAASRENAKALEGSYFASLGLSATPERPYDSGLEEILVPKLGAVVYRYSQLDAVRDGVLTPFILRNVRVPLAPHEHARYDRLSRRLMHVVRMYGADSDAAHSLLRRRASVAASARARIPVAIHVALAYVQAGERVLVFHERISAAAKIAAGLKRHGVSAAEYHTRMHAAMRQSNLALFRRGIIQVLVACRALDEGLDVPEASCAVIASSTATERQRIQRIGRVLRVAAGKRTAEVVSLYCTRAEQLRLQQEAKTIGEKVTVTWERARYG